MTAPHPHQDSGGPGRDCGPDSAQDCATRALSASRAGGRPGGMTGRSGVPSPASAAAELSHPSAAAEASSAGSAAVDATPTARDGGLPDADMAAAVDAGMLTYAEDGEGRAREVAAATVAAAARLHRHFPDPHAEVDWANAGLGRIMPIVPASAGAGASVVAAVLADALAELGWRVLLVDLAEAARSGLAYAANSNAVYTSVPGADDSERETVRLCWTWRRHVLVARLEASVPVLAPGLIPPPPCWRPPAHFGGAPQITIADCSVDAWRLAAHPLTGAGAWLRAGTGLPRPVLVVRPSRPSLRAAEDVLSRLEPWTSRGLAVSAAAMAVVGTKQWPPGVVGAAGRRVTSLLDRTVLVPHDPTVATDGITPERSPQQLQEAFAPLVHAWGLAPPQPSRRPRRRWWGGGRR